MQSSVWLASDDGEDASSLFSSFAQRDREPQERQHTGRTTSTSASTSRRWGWPNLLRLFGKRGPAGGGDNGDGVNVAAPSPPPRPPPRGNDDFYSGPPSSRANAQESSPQQQDEGVTGEENDQRAFQLAARYSRAKDWAARVLRSGSRDVSSDQPQRLYQDEESEGEAAGGPVAPCPPPPSRFHFRWGAATMARLGFRNGTGTGPSLGLSTDGEDAGASLTHSFLFFSDDGDDDDGDDDGTDGVTTEGGATPISEWVRLLPLENQDEGHSRRQREPSTSSSRAPSLRRTQLASLALVFVNFAFVVAAMTMLMAGVITEVNSVINLCGPCRRLGTASLALGGVLLFTSLWGFVCLQRRHVPCLLVYAGTVGVLLCGLTVVIVLAAVYDGESRFPTTTDSGYMLHMWEGAVNKTYEEGNRAIGRVWGKGFQPRAADLLSDSSLPNEPVASSEDGEGAVEESAVCRAQRDFHCSGFYFGCCRPGVCYDLVPAAGSSSSSEGAFNSSAFPFLSPSEAGSLPSAASASASAGPRLVPPPWVRRVCPRCSTAAENMSATVCTGEVYTTVRRNMTAFLLMTGYSWALMAGGSLLAWLARRAARQRWQRRRRRMPRYVEHREETSAS